MKKLFFLLLALVLLLAFLSGCEDKPKDDCEKGGDAPALDGNASISTAKGSGSGGKNKSDKNT